MSKKSTAPKSSLLTCPVRGALNVSALAKDGLTLSEEARRIEMMKFLLRRKYLKSHIAVETVVIKNLGESGRNKLRCDAIVYSKPVKEVIHLEISKRLEYAILIAEVKRDSKNKNSGINHQLEPALRQLPSHSALGVYWDDVTRLLLVKKVVTGPDGGDVTKITHDDIANLPESGGIYKEKAITFDMLAPPDNLVATLISMANVMRSNGINDEHLRYKETVKLILARYCDEKKAANTGNGVLDMQVKPGKDVDFKRRIDNCYKVSAKRYSNAKTLFTPIAGSELPEKALRESINLIQGIHFQAANSEMMQQLFMSFVPAVFKKSLDQYFTPLSLIQSMVDVVRIGPNDKIADPGMGTADFLTAALNSRLKAGDTDIDKRIFGMDIDQKAYDLAVINMILHKDGQTGLKCCDSIANHKLLYEEMNVVFCNPPFGEKSVSKDPSVLNEYDLGHQWKLVEGKWTKTEALLPSQQLGILFLERCYKMLDSNGGRLAIILPEGYLCTTSYGYVRQWIVDHLRIVSLVELPRRIFLKSDADLRSSILVCEKHPKAALNKLIKANYAIHSELVRKVGYKLGSGFQVSPKRDQDTGVEIRDEFNVLVPDTDFEHTTRRCLEFSETFALGKSIAAQVKAASKDWIGGRISDVLRNKTLDIKPRRLAPKALTNINLIKSGSHVYLKDIADVVTETVDIGSEDAKSKKWGLIEGQDIRAVEGIVIAQEPMRGWKIAERKGSSMYALKTKDIIIGLVRPERRNVGLLISSGSDLVGSPDGVAVVRVKPEFEKIYPVEWLFAKLRSEAVRLQFWTESGGTSYGKLTSDHILNIILSTDISKDATAKKIKQWIGHHQKALAEWEQVGTPDDRKPILNSPIFGLEWPETTGEESEIEDDGYLE